MRARIRSSGGERDSSCDLQVAALAARQRALISDGQLSALGVGRGAVAYRIGVGRMRRIHPGVLLVGVVMPPLAAELAAVMTCGVDARLSGTAAAVLHSMLLPSPGPLEVSAPGRQLRRRGLVVRRVQPFAADDVTHIHGIPVTSPARTLLDLAAAAHPLLDRAWNEALVQHLTTPTKVLSFIDRRPQRPGVATLRRLVELEQAPRVTRSEAELRFLALVDRAGLPRPQTNINVHGHEVDAFWPTERLAVEIDGYAFHHTRRAFERDHRRDADLAAHGVLVLRLSWRQITQEPELTVARLAAALARVAER